MRTPNIKIFLSYSHSDSAVAKNLSSSLENLGATCFMAEKDISAGAFHPRVQEAQSRI